MAKGGTKILFGFLFFVLLAGGLAGGGAWYLTESHTAGYRATATLLVENGYGPLPLHPPGPGGPASSHRPGPPGSNDQLREHMAGALGLPPALPSEIAPPDYATLFTTDQMAASLRDTLPGLYSEHGLEAGEITLASVRGAMEAEAPVALQTRDNVVYRRVISLHYTSPHPEVAAAAANAWAEASRDFAGGLASEEHERRQRMLNEKRVTLARELDEARSRLQAFREAIADSGSNQQAVDGVEARKTLRNELQALEQRIARDEAAMAALKSYVSKAPVAVVLELSVKEAELESTLAGSKAELEHLKKKLAETGDVTQAADTEQGAVQNEVEMEMEMEDLEATIARLWPRIERTDEALARLSEGHNPVRIAARAVAPDAPAGPHRYVIVAGAAALGMIIGMIVYFALLTLRVYARELDRR